VRAAPPAPGREIGFAPVGASELAERGFELTEMGWPVVPDAFQELLVRIHQTYRPPAVYVTENGAAFADQVVGGAVHDPRRIAYLDSHIDAVA
jgi:beta-glucosidase